jgi:uncharacterized protein YoxC
MAENGVVEILRGIQVDIAGLKSDMTGLKSDMTGLKHDMAGLKSDMTGLKHDMAGIKADVAGLKTDMRSHSDTLNILLQDTREIRSALNDIERTRVSVGEIEALHSDVTRMQRGLADLAARIEYR